MRRREFITLLGGATAAWPRRTMAQQSGIPTVGFLGTGSSSGWQPWVSAFVQRLNELGWIDGRTITMEYRWGEGRRERFAEIASEFVRLKVNVIVTGEVQFLQPSRRHRSYRSSSFWQRTQLAEA
jgi:hypothetical protein